MQGLWVLLAVRSHAPSAQGTVLCSSTCPSEQRDRAERAAAKYSFRDTATLVIDPLWFSTLHVAY